MDDPAPQILPRTFAIGDRVIITTENPRDFLNGRAAVVYKDLGERLPDPKRPGIRAGVHLLVRLEQDHYEPGWLHPLQFVNIYQDQLRPNEAPMSEATVAEAPRWLPRPEDFRMSSKGTKGTSKGKPKGGPKKPK